jgi:hypothetical protein
LKIIFRIKHSDLTAARKFAVSLLRKNFSSPNVIRIIKSEQRRWEENTVPAGKISNNYTMLAGKSKTRRRL